MNIKRWEIITVAIVVGICLGIGLAMIMTGSQLMMDALSNEAKLQYGTYNPSVYMDFANYKATLRAKNFMFGGAAVCGIGMGVVGIYFTAKWIKSLIRFGKGEE